MDIRSLLKEILEAQGRVLVVGLGISGIEAALALKRIGLDVLCVEEASLADYQRKSKYAARLEEIEKNDIEVIFSITTSTLEPLLDDIQFCVLSPGVPYQGKLCALLKDQEIPISNEMEVGTAMLAWPIVMVTGTNGKSTTVTLIHEIFLHAGFNSCLCGNIGTPVMKQLGPEALDSEPDPAGGVLVVEASSYQLESSIALSPKLGIFLNLSSDHLKRHGTMENYLAIKASPFFRQKESQYAVLNLNDPYTRTLQAQLESQVFGIGAHKSSNTFVPGAFFDYIPKERIDKLHVRLIGEEETYDLSHSCLIGEHNRYNMAASVLAARLMGIAQGKVQEALDSFKGLEHRLEFVDIKDITVINDSKSTTVASTIAAVEAVKSKYPRDKINLMLGGEAKLGLTGDGGFDELFEILGQTPTSFRPIVCFGGDADYISSCCSTAKMAHAEAPSLKKAVEIVSEQVGAGEVVLFSPGCASFDEFTDFEERGAVFKSLVKDSFV